MCKNLMKIAVLAIITFSFCLANFSRGEIEVKVDRFDGSTTVQTKVPTKPKTLVKRPRFDLIGRYTGEAQRTKPGIAIMLISLSEEWQYLSCNTTYWLVDDKPLGLPQPTHKGSIRSGFVVEYLIIAPVPLSALQQMAAAKKVEFKVCNDEFTLNKEEMADLRKFVGIFERP